MRNDKTNSLGVKSTGNITINGPSASNMYYPSGDNGNLGIEAFSFGKISVKGYYTDENLGGGAYLYNLDALYPKDVTVSISSFNDTVNGKGLEIHTRGKVTLTSVNAYGNDVVEGPIGLGQTVHEKISSNANSMEDAWKYIETRPTGQIAGSLRSAYNSPSLVVLDVTDSGNVVFDSAVSSEWVNGQFWFDTIQDHEYRFIVSMTENDSYTFKLYGYLDEDSNAIPDEPPDQYHGLGGTGIYIDNSSGTAGVTFISPVNVTSGVNNNSADGLFVKTNGAVSVKYLDSWGNGGTGVNIMANTAPGTLPAAVNLSNLETSDNGQYGVRALTLGSIIYSSSSSSWNGAAGAYLDNCREIEESVCEAAGIQPVTLSKLTFYDYKGVHAGLEVYSRGNITAGGIQVTGDYENGVLLKNAFSRSTGLVTLLGTLGQNKFTGSWYGIYISSNGNVTLGNILAEHNYEAVHITTQGKVMLSSGWFESNVNGIWIDSSTAVVMTKLTVMRNYGSGIVIFANSVSPVALTFSTVFGNQDYGLLINDSTGAPVLTGTLIFGNDTDSSGDTDVMY